MTAFGKFDNPDRSPLKYPDDSGESMGRGMDTSYPPVGRAQPAHLGSQSTAPGKEEMP